MSPCWFRTWPLALPPFLRLGADEIVMHPHASLGPIDPQIRMQDQNGVVRQFAYEDVGAFLDFIAQDVRITEQVHTSAIIERLFAVVDPVNVGAAKRASSLSTEMGERLLRMHMSQPEDQAKRRQIAEDLNKKFFAHGDAVSRSRAKELGLKLADPNPDLERLIWEAYCGLESHMNLRKPFVPLHDYLEDPQARQAMQPPAALQLPSNVPPQVQQQILQQLVANALQAAAGGAYQVQFSYLIAVCESVRGASEVRSEGRMWATALATAEIKLGMIEEKNGWKSVNLI